MHDAPAAEEVAHDRRAVLREHRLGVELHAPVVESVDLERLDHAVLAAGVHRDAGDLFDVQGVVAHHLEALRDASEDALAGMGDGGDEPVTRLGRAGDAGTGEHGQPLVAEAHAEQRDAGVRGCLDDAPGSAEVLLALRCAGAGGDDHVAELAGAHPLRKVAGLARGDHQGLAAGGLSNEVGEVECI